MLPVVRSSSIFVVGKARNLGYWCVVRCYEHNADCLLLAVLLPWFAGNKVVLNKPSPEHKVEDAEFEPNEVYAIDIVVSSGQ